MQALLDGFFSVFGFGTGQLAQQARKTVATKPGTKISAAVRLVSRSYWPRHKQATSRAR
jgi:hypothetical protein